MLYFIPAWYKQNMWCENEQQWYMRRLKSEFDETIKQITLFHRNVDRPYRILVLGYSPNFRHFLHRQGMYRSKYWSCFDAIAQVRRKKVAVLSYHDIKWPKGLEFVYSPFSIIALQGDVKYAQVEFGEDGNPISIDMFEDGKICRRNYYDDRGFVSSTVIYENGIEQYQDFLMENGIWKIREYKNDGHVVVNQTCPDYDVVPDAKSGKAGEPVEMRFTKAEYDSLEAVIEEVFASYVNLTRQNDNFFVAMHPLHIRVAEHVLKGKRIIATFFENRFDFTQTSLAADFLEHAENIITDSDYTTKLIMENLGAVNNKPLRLHITDIPPYDTRMDFGISSQLRVQNILVPVDGLTEDAFARIIKGLADYLTINDLARVHFFTRDASWGHEDAIKNDTVKLLDSMGYDSRLVTGDGEAALGFGGSGADVFAENELGDIEKTVEQRFFVDVCVDERDISKCINEQVWEFDEEQLQDVFRIDNESDQGPVFVSILARGTGSLNIISLHDRHSRRGHGFFLPGGERLVSSKGEEVFVYFEKGDMKPPLAVYFSGYRTQEGFEGYYMMRGFGCPFILVTDPRSEGGAFYLGDSEFEQMITDYVTDKLDELGLTKDELVLSGASMGTFGSLYYGSKLSPHALLLAKPLANMGNVARNERILRAGGFATSLDILMKNYDNLSDEAIEQLNNRMWDRFDSADWSQTKFIISYLYEDDYDPDGYPSILSHLKSSGVEVYGKGSHGRHTDNSANVMAWFKSQYNNLLHDDFSR